MCVYVCVCMCVCVCIINYMYITSIQQVEPVISHKYTYAFYALYIFFRSPIFVT